MSAEDNLDNRQGTVRALADHGTAQISAGQILDNSDGRIEANSQSLTISASQLNNNSGTIQQAGEISAGKATTLNITGNVENDGGQLLTRGALSLNAEQLNNSRGEVYSTGGMTFGLTGLNNNEGLIYNRHASGLNLSTTSQLQNREGRLVSQQALTINSAGFTEHGWSASSRQ